MTEVTIDEAKSILENKIERTVITCDGEKLTKQEKIKNKTYLLGTDGLGRDLFIRIVYGARISLLVGLFAAFINFVVGVFYGAIAGYCGGTVDNIMMRIIDVLGLHSDDAVCYFDHGCSRTWYFFHHYCIRFDILG